MSSPSTTIDLWSAVTSTDPAVAGAWITGVLTALGTVASVAIAAGLAYQHARKHSKEAHNTTIRVDRLRREIDALERIWGLLAYMTFGENKSAIVRYREDKQKNRTYYLSLPNLRHFLLTEVRDAFYSGHAGLHLPMEIRDKLFDYTGSLMGLYLKYEENAPVNAELIALENPRLIDKLRDAYDSLNALLKAELEERYEQMLAAK